MKKYRILALLLVLLFAFASCNSQPDVIIDNRPIVEEMGQDEAALIAGSYINAISATKTIDTAHDLIMTYCTESLLEYARENYPNTVKLVETIIASGTTIDDTVKSAITAALPELKGLVDAEKQPTLTQILTGLETGLPEVSDLGSLLGIILAPVTVEGQINIIPLLDELSEVIRSVIDEMVSSKVNATVGNYALSISSYDVHTKDSNLPEDGIKQILLSLISSAGDIINAILGITEQDYSATVKLTLLVSANTMDSSIFKYDSMSYKGDVYLTADLDIGRTFDLSISDYDLDFKLNSISASSGNLTVKATADGPQHTLRISNVQIPLNLYFDYENADDNPETDELTIEPIRNKKHILSYHEGKGFLISPKFTEDELPLVDFSDATGYISYDGISLPFGDVLENTDQR